MHIFLKLLHLMSQIVVVLLSRSFWPAFSLSDQVFGRPSQMDYHACIHLCSPSLFPQNNIYEFVRKKSYFFNLFFSSFLTAHAGIPSYLPTLSFISLVYWQFDYEHSLNISCLFWNALHKLINQCPFPIFTILTFISYQELNMIYGQFLHVSGYFWYVGKIFGLANFLENFDIQRLPEKYKRIRRT